MTEIFDRRRLQSHVRIWSKDKPIGSGFVLGPRHVMTCAHVVAAASGSPAKWRGNVEAPVEFEIKMDMPIAPREFVHGRVVAEKWRPESGKEAQAGLDDVAVLELCEGSLPNQARPVGKTRQVKDADLIIGYGVSTKQPDGVIIRGRYQGLSLPNRFQIVSEEVDEAIRPGCSGAAAWNSTRRGVAGMVIEMQQQRVGRVIPIDVLEEVWPFEWEDELEHALPPKPSQADLALKGLDELAETGSTRAFVRTYERAIMRTSACANAVGDLKELHDLLDQIRHSVYEPLRSVSARLPAPDAIRDLAGYGRQYALLISRMAKSASSLGARADEFSWIDEDLAEAQATLDRALKEVSSHLVDEATGFMRAVVETELTGLDHRLAEAIKQLDLPELILGLRDLRAQLAAGNVAPEKVAGLSRDIETLAQIEDRLSVLIADHHRWQRIDARLNSLEMSLDQTLDDVARNWRLLESPVAKVRLDRSTQGSEQIAAAAEAFSKAVAARNETEVWITFNALATLLRNRFFAVDRALLEECERIRTVGNSLSAVVDKLDG